MMVMLPNLVQVYLAAYAADASGFAGLGKVGLITLIVISILIIVTTAWLINGTKKRD